jgi:hypothetical protein
MSDTLRRWLERGKSLLIIALTASALFLLYLSPLVQSSGLMDLISPSRTDASALSSSDSLADAAVPVRMAVGTDLGLYGVQYDQAAVDELFASTGPLLGEALSSAGAPATLSQGQWQALLSGQYLYFDFTSPVPLASLCLWLNDRTAETSLDGSARSFLLVPDQDGTIVLCYRDGAEGYFRCATELDATLHLTPLTESVTPNNAFFAFDAPSLSDAVSPLTLFTAQELRMPVYQCDGFVSSANGDALSQLLDALSFSDQNQTDVSSGFIYVDGEDTLRLSTDRQAVYYSSSGGGKYAAGDGLAGAVDAAWTLADAALTGLCGEARLYLVSAQADDNESDSYTVTFGYALSGAAVYLSDQGWAAQFQVRDGSVVKFTLYPRTYTSTGELAILMTAETAASAVTALADTPLELAIQYRDTLGDTASPGWVGR